MSMNQYKEVYRMAPRRRLKTQIVVISVILFTLVLVLHQILSNSNTIWQTHGKASGKNFKADFLINEYSVESTGKDFIPPSEPFLGEKLVHLDLKGAPPLLSYLRQFIPFIKKLGATGILIEYEDMFPYKDELEGIKALNSYSISDIQEILDLAESYNLSVIPLIQTFGHFEFVLKLQAFKDLREIDKYPQVLCPSHERVFSIIKKMIDQILEVHSKSKHIHIGCDEVFYLGRCSRCTNVMNENNWNANHLFLNHVKNIAKYITRTYPSVRPIMWGDMVAKNDEKLLEKYQIPSLVDLMLWKYVPNVIEYITDDLLDLCARLFKKVWIASAFKGATGVNQMVTNAKYHLANHIAWMNIVSKWKNFMHFKGIALTGWQRYDHFAELCELLPVSIPSLSINLEYLKGSRTGVHQNVILNTLQCSSPIAFTPTDINFVTITKCNFPGFNVYQLINKFYIFSTKIEGPSLSLTKGWFSVYNVVNKFSSPIYVQQIFDRWPIDEYRSKIRYYEEEIAKALSEVYDEYTVKEWIETHVTPIRIKLDAIYIAKETILDQNIWPRRPLLNGSNSLEKAANEICSFSRKFGCGLLLI